MHAERRWVFASHRRRITRGFDSGGRIVVEDGPFAVQMDHQVVRPGISLFTGGGRSPQGYSFSPTGEMPSRNLVLGMILGGAGTIVADGNADTFWRQPGQMYAVSLSERSLRYDIEPDADYSSAAVMLTPEALEVMATEEGLPEVAAGVLAGRAPPISLMRAMPAAARQAAEALVRPAFQGTMGRLFREAKALELLAYQFQALADTPHRAADLGARDLMRVREARELLLTDLQAPPDIATLAAAVKLTPKRLNQGFRQLYGMTVFALLLEERMQLARRVLEDGPDTSLKQLAWMVGYSHPSNFIVAFQRRFGATPGSFRRLAP